MQLQIEEATRKLRTGDLGIAANPEERFAFFIVLISSNNG